MRIKGLMLIGFCLSAALSLTIFVLLSLEQRRKAFGHEWVGLTADQVVQSQGAPQSYASYYDPGRIGAVYLLKPPGSSHPGPHLFVIDWSTSRVLSVNEIAR